MFIFYVISGIIYLAILLALTYSILNINEIPRAAHPVPPISVIIAARNEEENLSKNLPAILAQNYPNFEVILVLDRCSDNSKAIVESFQEDYPHLTYVEIESLPTDWAGKKWALNQGIQVSMHDYLAFTDADCVPESHWLSHLSAHFQKPSELVLGLGLYQKAPSLLNNFIQFETLYTALQYVGMAKLGKPYMAVGRNLAYRKSFYLKNKGFEGFQDRISGDDDILVNKYGAGTQVSCMIEPGSRTFSQAKSKFKPWLNQKLRHLSASPAYSASSKVFLSLFHLSHLFFYLGLFIFFFQDRTLSIFLASYIIRMVISWILFMLIKRKLTFNTQLYLFPVLDLLYFIYNLSLVPIGLIQKRTAWS